MLFRVGLPRASSNGIRFKTILKQINKKTRGGDGSGEGKPVDLCSTEPRPAGMAQGEDLLENHIEAPGKDHMWRKAQRGS
jgi:hypothetical protein